MVLAFVTDLAQVSSGIGMPAIESPLRLVAVRFLESSSKLLNVLSRRLEIDITRIAVKLESTSA